jgi:type II secretory pathway component PulM
MSQGKEATFWHLILEGKDEEERIPDMRRCERIRWPRPMIEAIELDKVHVWRSFRGRNKRIVIAVADYSYVVVLDDREDYALLWTAYFVKLEHQRKKLAREHKAWDEHSGKS